MGVCVSGSPASAGADIFFFFVDVVVALRRKRYCSLKENEADYCGSNSVCGCLLNT